MNKFLLKCVYIIIIYFFITNSIVIRLSSEWYLRAHPPF